MSPLRGTSCRGRSGRWSLGRRGRWGLAGGIGATAVLVTLFAAGSKVDDPVRPPSRAVGPLSMTDAEREAYLKQHVTLENLALGPDRKPKDEGLVPGLLRFSGTVRNRGTRTLAEAHLSVYPHDTEGKVIASYLEEILDGRALGPGETRDFAFRIPARSAFSGAFSHRLR